MHSNSICSYLRFCLFLCSRSFYSKWERILDEINICFPFPIPIFGAFSTAVGLTECLNFICILEQEVLGMRRKVLSLSQSFNGIKEANLLLPSSASKELVEDPLKAMERSQRWKLTTAYSDVGLRYQEDQAIAYVAARMPAVYSALYRVLSEVQK